MEDYFVCSLLCLPFTQRNFVERLEIVNRGRPKPKLELQLPGKRFTMHFSEANYDRFKWLTAIAQS